MLVQTLGQEHPLEEEMATPPSPGLAVPAHGGYPAAPAPPPEHLEHTFLCITAVVEVQGQGGRGGQNQAVLRLS